MSFLSKKLEASFSSTFSIIEHLGLFVSRSRVRAAIHLLSLQGEFPTSCHCGNKMYSQSHHPSVILYRKTASNKQRLFILSVCNPEPTRGEQQATLCLHLSFSPLIIRSIPLPLHAKDSAKATAIVFKLFILSQDCAVIYNVNTENTL